MSKLKEILLKRRLQLKNEKKINIIEKLKNYIEYDIDKKRKFKLSKAIKYAKDRNPIITEIKPASPSKGKIKEINEKNILDIAKAMIEGGCIGISILTEPNYFNGSYKNLILVRRFDIPILMKDFIIDKYQIDIANEIGANAILLIVKALGDDLGKFLDYADDYKLECLVETHNEKEIDIALNFGAKIIGINNRDLDTLKIDLSTTERLSSLIPKNKIKISESGIYKRNELKYVLECCDAALIGSSIMESNNIMEKVKTLVFPPFR